MTAYYVDSAGSNTAPYDTWAKAATILGTVGGIAAAGDTIYLASSHSESGSNSLAFAGTITSPTRIISADKTSGAPPTIVAAGASITITGTLSQTGTIYCYGVTFSSAGSMTLAQSPGGACLYEGCSFRLTTANAAHRISVALGAIWKDCSVRFAHAGQSIEMGRSITRIGGSVLSGGTSPTTLLTSTLFLGRFVGSNIDLSNCSATVNLTSYSTIGGTVEFRNCKTPSGWSGLLNSLARPTGQKAMAASLINGDYAATNYQYQRWDNYGDVYHETTHVMTGGSSDGTTTLAWKLVSQAHAATFPVSRLECAELTFWNKTTGVARTVTLEYLHDNVTGLKNDEFWIEVDYLGSSSTPIGSMASSAKADVLQAGAANPSSAATWNTTGLSNPNAQNVSVTFTPQMVGLFIVRICLCKASYTVYADRKVTVT